MATDTFDTTSGTRVQLVDRGWRRLGTGSHNLFALDGSFRTDSEYDNGNGASIVVLGGNVGTRAAGRWVIRSSFAHRGNNTANPQGAEYYDRIAAVMFDGQIEIQIAPAQNRITISYDGALKSAASLPSGTFVVSGGLVTTSPSTLDLAWEVDAQDRLALTFNGTALELLPLSGFTGGSAGRNYQGTRTGASGLRIVTPEGFDPPHRLIADEFSSYDAASGGGTPTPTPPSSKTHTIGAKSRFLPRVPGGSRVESFTATKTGGGTIASAAYRVLALVGSTETQVVASMPLGSPSIASDNSAITGNVPLPVNRSRDERWVVEITVTYSDNTTSVAKSVPIAVGALFAFYGQSNAVLRRVAKVNGGQRPAGAFCLGHLNPTGPAGTPQAMTWRGPYDTDEVNTMLIPAGIMAQHLNMPVGFFSAGKSGGDISEMLPPNGSGWNGGYNGGAGPNFDDAALLTQIARAGGAPEGVVFDQGENNANTTNQAGYIATFRDQLVPALRDVTGRPALPIAVVMLGRYSSSTPPGNANPATVAQASLNYQAFRAAQVQMVQGLTNVGLAGTSLGAAMADEYHYNAAGFELKGARDAQSLAKLFGVDTFDGRGPLPTSATINGTTVRVALDLNGATGVSGSALTGYETSADGGSTWSVVPSADATIVSGAIELRNRPAGTNRVRSFYGMNYDESSLAQGAYSPVTGGPAAIPVFPIVSPMTVSSSGTPTPTPVIPSNTQAPVISGSAVVGSTLTRSTAGTWTGAQSIALQWLRGSTAISGATGASYVTQSADVGQAVRLRETATSSTGDTATAQSNAITVTPAPAPTPTPGTTPRGPITAQAPWKATFSATAGGSVSGSNPLGAVQIGAQMDPHTRRDLAFDFSSVLGPDGEIANLTKVAVGATALLDGFRIATDPPIRLSVDGKSGQLRAYILPDRQDDALWNGTGATVPITIKGAMTDGQDVEDTLLITVRNR